ncbi:hypothetical protein TrVFT333_005478 [Trichoderma virens FT-333]|nr:hypothetical protein TrVFT333_005478 [Trichoderma virens FT-333]
MEDESNSPSDYRALVRKLGQSQSHKLQHLDRLLPEECQNKLKLPSRMLNERIEYLLSNVEHARVWEGVKERMETQQTVLFNLIAQSDNLVNISLAKDSKEMAVASKQDSSAMKIIALLTTFFLPGTFIASFFAMPLFDWSEPSLNHVTTRHFWVFWAVTGPVTLATMAGVIAWALWNNRRVELLQSRARESVGTKSQGDNGQDTDKEQSTRKDSNEGGITNEDQAPKSGTDGVRNLKKYSLLGILSRRRRRSGSTKAEP